MKQLMLVLVMTVFSSTLWAQKPVSTIRFSTTDNDAITVILNERDFNKIGRSITFRDLPRKRHYVQIYKVTANQETGRNRGIPIYSGNVKLEPGKIYDAVLDKQSKKLRVYSVKSLPELVPNTASVNNGAPAVVKSSNGLNDVVLKQTEDDIMAIPVNFESGLSSSMQLLKKNMEQETLDKNKIKLATEYIHKNKITAYEGRAIVSWLLFEDSKIELANQLKNKISDKENIAQLTDAFTYQKTRDQFLSEL